MSDNGKINLTRRKILAGMGAVGAAGAGAGLGTSALFSDEEGFENNTLTAGTLDLKMDWEEHYSFPQVYDKSFGDSDFTDPTVEGGTSLDVTRSDPANDQTRNASEYAGLPDPKHPVVWANKTDDPLGTGESSLELYFQNTVIEAFPDGQGTPIEPTFTTLNSGDKPVVQSPCNQLADIPSPGLSTYNRQSPPSGENFQNPGRTWNADTYDRGSSEREPLLNLTDVKPGDFGEFTFSTHLCNNDGYLWLTMPTFNPAENTVIEPEPDSDDASSGELEENIRTTVWYDNNCNNRIDGGQDLVALAIIDTSGSTSSILSDIRAAANQFVKELQAAQDSDTRIFAGVIRFDDNGDNNDVILEFPIQNIDNYVSGGSGIFDSTNLPNTSGTSPIPHALDTGREYLNDKAADLAADPSLNISDPNKQMLLVSDGDAGYQTSGSDALGRLLDSPGGSLFSYDGNTYTSDFFDGLANESTVELPDPDGGDISGQIRAETALVARDIDGNPFLPPGSPQHQPAGPKDDLPDSQGPNNDPKEISGANDITVRAVAVYPSTASSGDIDRARDTMMAYASSDGAYYDLPMGGATGPNSVTSDLVSDLNVTGTETTIFRNITLKELNNKLPVQLDSDLTTSENDCFTAGTTHCFGLAWWLPEDVGNVVQSDSVQFDLGFYTEQCRNNPTPDGPS